MWGERNEQKTPGWLHLHVVRGTLAWSVDDIYKQTEMTLSSLVRACCARSNYDSVALFFEPLKSAVFHVYGVFIYFSIVCIGSQSVPRRTVRKLKPPFVVELKPMEIRTFNVTVEYM